MSSPLRRNAFGYMALYLFFIMLGGMVFTVVEKLAEEELHRSFLMEDPCVRERRLSELMGKALAAHCCDVVVLTTTRGTATSHHRSTLSSLL